MTTWNAYWQVFQQDLWRFFVLLLTAGPPLLFLAIGVAYFVGRRYGRPGERMLGATSLIATFVSLIAGMTSYLLGWGLAHLLFRNWDAPTRLIPTWYWIALWTVSFWIAAVLSYRHSAAWLQACLAADITTGQSSPVGSQRRPFRASFTLATLVAYQLIALLAIGIWIECRRDWALEQYAEQQRLAEYARWEQSIEERFGSRGFVIRYSGINEPERFLSLMRQHPMSGWSSLPADFLQQIEPEDGLVTLHLRSDELTDADLRFIARHPRLTHLFLAAPQVTDTGIAELKNLTNLQSMQLSCPKLTDDCLKSLPKFQGTVWIESPHFTKEAVDRFNEQDGYPGLRVMWKGAPAP